MEALRARLSPVRTPGRVLSRGATSEDARRPPRRVLSPPQPDAGGDGVAVAEGVDGGDVDGDAVALAFGDQCGCPAAGALGELGLSHHS